MNNANSYNDWWAQQTHTRCIQMASVKGQEQTVWSMLLDRASWFEKWLCYVSTRSWHMQTNSGIELPKGDCTQWSPHILQSFAAKCRSKLCIGCPNVYLRQEVPHFMEVVIQQAPYIHDTISITLVCLPMWGASIERRWVNNRAGQNKPWGSKATFQIRPKKISMSS